MHFSDVVNQHITFHATETFLHVIKSRFVITFVFRDQFKNQVSSFSEKGAVNYPAFKLSCRLRYSCKCGNRKKCGAISADIAKSVETQ